jgi:hypothetical protein
MKLGNRGSPLSLRVYKFLGGEHALDDIRRQRIKISEIHDLNDPFELIPCNLSDPIKREAMLSTRDQLSGNRGLVCFASAWNNPVLWAHYSDKHRGMCLGFDVKEEVAKRITYSQQRIPWKDVDLEFVQDILWTKFSGWSYEDEVRVYASRDEEENGMYFKDFDDDFRLKEVIVGHRCCIERGQISAALASYAGPVKIIKACLSFTSFDVIEDKNGFTS